MTIILCSEFRGIVNDPLLCDFMVNDLIDQLPIGSTEVNPGH